MNIGGVDEWLKQAPEKNRRKIMQLTEYTPHTCSTCWWLQFKEGQPNRACRYDDFNKNKMPYQKVPEALSWICKGWRIDPEVRKRSQGTMGLVM